MSNVRMGITCLGLFAAGVAVGGLTALLIAPDSGRETRRKLAERYTNEKRELLRKGQRAVGDVAQRLEDGIESGRQKIDSALRT
jgi:gas vesicle protein